MKKPKKLFVGTRITHGTVMLNCVGSPGQEFGFYGEAFHTAGKLLAQDLKNDPKFRRSSLIPLNSFKALPILYLYRHALELHLKALIISGAGMLPLRRKGHVNLERVLENHSLQNRLADVELIFEAFRWGWDFGLPHFSSLADFRSVIAELETIDRKSFAFRYPTGKDGRGALPRNFRFNLFEFCETLDPVFGVLSEKVWEAQAWLESEYEMRAAQVPD